MNNEFHESMNGTSESAGYSKGFSLQPGLKLEDLHNPDQVAQLWELCLANERTAGRYHDRHEDRLTFFAWAHHVWWQVTQAHKHRKPTEKPAKAIRKPIGFFHHVLLQGIDAIRKQTNDEWDNAWAKSVIARMECEEPQPVRRSAGEIEAIEAQDFEVRRLEQIRLLQEMMQGELR